MSVPDVSGSATNARHLARRLLRRGKYYTGDRPWLLPINIRLTPEGSSRAITNETDLIIEGFPRSGNTFAVFAFRQAQGPDVSVASHIHHLAPLKIGITRGIPVLAVVRSPMDCLASYLIAGPHARPKGVLKEYIHHHRGVLALADRLVVATFEQVTTNLSGVITRINTRYDTAFAPFEHSTENEEEVFAAIAQYHGAVHREKEAARVVPTPTEDRKAEAALWRAQLMAPELSDLRQLANTLYEQLDAVAQSG